MSNSILNYHIENGEPCGSDADIIEIADYYGQILFDLKEKIETINCLCSRGSAIAGEIKQCNQLLGGEEMK